MSDAPDHEAPDGEAGTDHQAKTWNISLHAKDSLRSANGVTIEITSYGQL